MSNKELPTSTEEKIKADAEAATRELNKKEMCEPLELMGYRKGYNAGATAVHERAQVLADALEKINDSPVPANEREMLSWIETVRSICETALTQWKGKEVEPVNEIEYMPILSYEIHELKEIPNVPSRVPMHLLSEEQAMSNHGQTLKRLKERGGLGVKEAIALIKRQPYKTYGKMDNTAAVVMLNEIINNP